LIEHFRDHPYVEIHSTGTDGGDLRVRTKFGRVTKGGRGQNIFTMAWQPRKKVFRCRFYFPVEATPVSEGFVRVRPSRPGEPLPCEVDYEPWHQNHAGLIAAVELAITRYRQDHP
jgi:hypothetical protein